MAGERPPSSARRGARAPGAPPALLCLLLLLLLLCVAPRGALGAGTVVNTWPFTDATAAAYAELVAGGSHVDAVVAGCSRCEELQCDGSVGFGGSPDERGETTLDAMVMDAETMNVGSVGALRGVKGASRAARLVLDYTTQTLIVGEQAAAFAVGLGMEAESLETAGSMEVFEDWRRADCQPNFWADPTSSLSPDPKTSCGPYALASAGAPRGAAGGNLRDADLRDARARPAVAEGNHDTIGMVVIDARGGSPRAPARTARATRCPAASATARSPARARTRPCTAAARPPATAT